MSQHTSELQHLGRDALIRQITRNLRQMDDATLAIMARRLRQSAASDHVDAAGPGAERGMNRRQFLRTVAGVGALGAVATAGVGYAAWEFGGLRERTRAELELGAEIIQLRGLLALYDALEQVGLDDVVSAGLGAVSTGLRLLEKGADALQSGLQAIEDAVLKVDQAFPALQKGITLVESGVEVLADGLQRLEDILADFAEPAQPITDAISRFVSQVLDYLPFGAGDTIRQGLETTADILTTIPEHVLAVNTELLEPLREQWFSTDPEDGLLSGMFEVLVTRVLDPLQAHLSAISDFSNTWQEKLESPVRAAIEERNNVRRDLQAQRRMLGM